MENEKNSYLADISSVSHWYKPVRGYADDAWSRFLRGRTTDQRSRQNNSFVEITAVHMLNIFAVVMDV